MQIGLDLLTTRKAYRGRMFRFSIVVVAMCIVSHSKSLETEVSINATELKQHNSSKLKYGWIQVQSQKPTAVSAAATGNFTSPDDLNLVVAKTTRLEIFLVSAEGLKPLHELPVYGRVAVLMFFRPNNESKDLLFLLTAKYHAAILEYSEGELCTRAYGNVADRIGRPSETGIIAVIDAKSQLIGLRLYDGLLKIIEWQPESRELKAFNLRFDDLNVIDLQFLHGYDRPTLAYIHQDQNGRHLKTVQINFEEKEFVNGPWKQDNIESEASMLLPISQLGGCVLIGQETISYHKEEGNYVAVAPPIIHQSTIVCTGQIDKSGSRFLMGDMAGRLFLLLLDIEDGMDGTSTVKDLKVEFLGETTIPECLVYLDNGVTFIGSRLGDSQLIRLCPQRCDEPRASFIELLESYTNLGPIVDMAVVDLDSQGQLVTCSGCFKEGSLRIIRNGIGINELASIDLPGIKGLWSMSYRCIDLDNVLAMSFVGQTKILQLNNEEVEEIDIPGIDSEVQTIWLGNVQCNGAQALLQVSANDVRVVAFDAASGEPLCSWRAPELKRLSLAAVNGKSGQLVVASGKDIYYLQVHPTEANINQVSNVSLEFEAACLDINPISDTDQSELCAVGLWTDISVRLLSLPKLDTICSEPLGGEILSRSILMAKLDTQLYLLVALGDGTLFYYQMDKNTGALLEPGFFEYEPWERKKVTLGTQPVLLRAFSSRGSTNVFACSDRPAVIYSSNQKLVFSNVNLKLVAHLCPLNTVAYRESLAMSDGHTLMIGTVDEIQKLHIRTVPLGETPRRIAHQPQTQTFAVITCRYETKTADGHNMQGRPSASTLAQFTSQSCAQGVRSTIEGSDSGEAEEVEVHSIVILDHNTFEVIHSHQLGPNETATSVISCHLGDDPTPYYLVGTALVYADESEAKQGRLIVFQYCGEGKLQLINEKEIKGCPYSLAILNGKVLAAINSSVRLFEWAPEKELKLECSHFNFITALYLKTKGDFVLAGDLMRSVCVLAYKSMESAFEEIARDYQPNWMTGVEIIDDDTFLGAENAFNLFTCQKDSAATTDEDRQRLQEIGAYHLGEMVNVFRRGSLVMQHPTGEAGPPLSTPVLYASVEGGIGLIAQVPEEYFKFLQELETRLSKVVKSAGKIDHTTWRSFHTERKTDPPTGFVDGDLIETYLDLNREVMNEVTQGLNMPFADDSGMSREATVDDLVKAVEDLTRVH